MMKFLSPLVLFVLCSLYSCRHKEQIPSDMIPLNRMKMIVWDIEIADQTAAGKFPEQKDSLRMEATSLYQRVFAKHKIKKTEFYRSFSFYESHPDIMKILFDSVTEYGNRQKTAAYKKGY